MAWKGRRDNIVLTVLTIVGTAALIPSPAASDVGPREVTPETTVVPSRGLGHTRLVGTPARVPVVLLLRTSSPAAVQITARRALLAPAPGIRERKTLRRRSTAETLAYARLQAKHRLGALRSLAGVGRLEAAEQLPVYRAIVRAGGRVTGASVPGHTITARVPRKALARLARRHDVAAIEPAPVMRALDIGQNSLSVGAPSWWSAGYTGGRGTADVPANFAVDQDPVMRSHPAFQGITFVTPPGAVEPGNPSLTRHGTALLSIAAAQGPTGCALCQPADAQEKGVVPGVGKVLDPSGAGAETDWAAGVPYYWYDDASSQWRLQAPAPDPAQVINYSRGSDTTEDDSLIAQAVDATVNDYGVTMTVAAGNSGPAPRTVNDPALAYNVIGVGAFSGGGTTDPSDDSIFAWSSRGPTVGGRKKPDLVAVGDGGLAYSYYQSTGQLWKYDTGTSYSAPQVGAGAILLAGAGIRDPKVVKAILVNSARPGRATPSSPMGTQVGWLPDWGWGEMNLDAAFHERLNFARDDVPSGGARFFSAAAQAAGDRATLVWNRRVADCKPLRQGCYYDTDSGFRVYTLSNLDLTEYDAQTGLQRAASTSTVDNVEQVRTPAAGTVIYKVSAGEVDGPGGEPFAIAATRPVTPLVTPQPMTSLTIVGGGPRRVGDPVSVVAQVVNPSADLTADNTQVTLDLPSGIELVSGSRAQTLGTLQLKGDLAASATASWTVRGTSDGVKQLTATATATKYGSTLRSSATDSFAIDGDPATATLVVPPDPTPDPGGGSTATPNPTPIPTRPLSPELHIARIQRRGKRLLVSGTVARGANGKVTAVWRTRDRVARASTYAQLRRFTLVLKAPKARRARLTVSYARDYHFARQASRRTLRWR